MARVHEYGIERVEWIRRLIAHKSTEMHAFLEINGLDTNHNRRNKLAQDDQNGSAREKDYLHHSLRD